MNKAVKTILLMVGLVCTYVAMAAPLVPPPDGGPIPTCNPKTGCGPKGYTLIASIAPPDGGPIPTCNPKKGCGPGQ